MPFAIAKRGVIALAGIAGLGALAACSSSGGAPVQPVVAQQQLPANVERACPEPDYSIAEAPRCFAVRRTDVGADAPGGYKGFYVIPGVTNESVLRSAHPEMQSRAGTPSGYGRSDLLSAYKLPATGGTGQTIGIVDFNDDPNVESDLGVYRSTYGLTPCTTANGCFKKVDQNGGTNYPHKSRSWGGEIALDVEMASAVCPSCKIVLVEVANDANAGEDTAINLGANVVSNSWGASLPSGYNAAFDHPGHIITVASGDVGFTQKTTYPDAYGTVVSVGGTTLNAASNNRGWTETAWSGSTSECSTGVTKPAWQADTGCSARTETDVSAVGDPQTGVAVYVTFGGSGWVVYGGTSVSSPIIAGVYALAGNEASLNYAQSVYTNASSLFDVTSGSNGSCPQYPAYICNATAGYDGPTGNGTPNGLGAF